jgi:hypothetical protein
MWLDVIQPLLHNVPQTLASRGQKFCGVRIHNAMWFKLLVAASQLRAEHC